MGRSAGPLLGASHHTSEGNRRPMARWGTLVVVDQPEQIELGLQLVERGRWRLLGEPAFQRLVEAFDLAAGSGDTGESGRHGHRRGAVRQRVPPEGVGVVGQESCWPAEDRRGGGDHGERGCPGAGRHRLRGDEQPGVVIDDVEDLHVGAVGELPGGVIELPAFVGSFGGEAAVGPLGTLGGVINDEPAGLEDPPDRRFRRQTRQAGEIPGDRRRPGIQPGIGESFTFGDDRILDTHRRLVRHRVSRPGDFASRTTSPALWRRRRSQKNHVETPWSLQNCVTLNVEGSLSRIARRIVTGTSSRRMNTQAHHPGPHREGCLATPERDPLQDGTFRP